MREISHLLLKTKKASWFITVRFIITMNLEQSSTLNLITFHFRALATRRPFYMPFISGEQKKRFRNLTACLPSPTTTNEPVIYGLAETAPGLNPSILQEWTMSSSLDQKLNHCWNIHLCAPMPIGMHLLPISSKEDSTAGLRLKIFLNWSRAPCFV